MTMHYQVVLPPPDLFDVVELVWFLRAPARPGTAPDRVLPDGTSEIVLNRADAFDQDDGSGPRRQPAAVWVGQISGPFCLRPTGAVDLVGVRIRAEGASRLVATPQAELSRRWFELGALRPTLARALAEALEIGGIDDGRVAEALFGALRRSLRTRTPAALASICHQARAHPGSTTVEALARDAGMSVRTLERRFLTHVGLSPKRWLRILRFQQVVADGTPGPDLLRRAFGAGYYDQAHFLRDFREFAGTTPGRFFQTDEDRLARAFLEGPASPRRPRAPAAIP